MFKYLSYVAAVAVLAGCSDPLAGFDRLRDVAIADDAPIGPAALPSEEEVAREGFFGTSAATGDVPAEGAAPAPQDSPIRRGLRGLFNRTTDEDAAVQEALGATPQEARTEAPVEIAALAPEETPSAAAPKRAGLLGLLRPKPETETPAIAAPRTGPDARDVPLGTILPFGEVARVCAAKGRDLGKRVERADAKGFALYDTAPNTIAARTFYLTGFPDGCARQLTAATVVLSSASAYEQFRFGPTSAHLPKGETDNAYAKIKRSTCGVGKNKPCGSAIKTLDRSTFFLSSYRDLGHAGEWSELLIHQGAVTAAAMKSYD